MVSLTDYVHQQGAAKTFNARPPSRVPRKTRNTTRPTVLNPENKTRTSSKSSSTISLKTHTTIQIKDDRNLNRDISELTLDTGRPVMSRNIDQEYSDLTLDSPVERTGSTNPKRNSVASTGSKSVQFSVASESSGATKNSGSSSLKSKSKYSSTKSTGTESIKSVKIKKSPIKTVPMESPPAVSAGQTLSFLDYARARGK